MWPKKTSKTPHHVLLISLIPLQWSIIIYSLFTNHRVYIGILNYATRVFCLGGKDKYQEKLYITVDERLNQDQSRISGPEGFRIQASYISYNTVF